jgi:DNA methyltransferase 1-associated protein 1
VLPEIRKLSKYSAGINREVLALHGDRAPPVAIIDSHKTFRAKLKRDFKPARWEFAAFTNDARRDDLQLRHWKRHKPIHRPSSGDAMDIENNAPEDASEQYRFAKYNVDISVPQYDDEKYARHLASAEWSREETDYLLGLVKEYAQKWPIIIDRYEWPPGSADAESTALVGTRTLEQLKARYYQVWVRR